MGAAPVRSSGGPDSDEGRAGLVHGEEGLASAQRATGVLFGAEIAGLNDAELSDIFADVRTLGALTGRAQAAEALAAQLEAGVAEIRESFAALPEGRFARDLAESVEVARPSVERRGFADRARLGLARLLSPLL